MTDLRCGDALEIMAAMPDNSVDLIATDPPYFKVKSSEWWDRQWDTAAGFLEWIGQLCEQWQRILRPNGSLYVFASSKMAARVEVEIGRWLNVLNSITWVKGFAWNKGDELKPARVSEDGLRSFYPGQERIIFAEHYGADGYAKGEAGYTAKCDELRGFVFEPLRAYLVAERDRAGLTTGDIDREWQAKTGTKGCMAGHWFGQSQWALPTPDNYHWLRDTFHTLNGGGEYLRRDYEDLRRDYEDLRRDYEDLRRPFNATAERPYTDVWTFPTVSHFNGKHPCEKPVALMEHIILTSSKPGAVVLDCFMGRGSTAEACLNTGRDFIGCDVMEKWVMATEKRVQEHQAQPMLEGMAL